MTEQKVDPRRQLYMSRLDFVHGQASSLSRQLQEVDTRVYSIDDSLNKLPARIQQIRRMNYRVLTNLEKDQSSLAERWFSVRSNVKDTISSSMPSISSEIRILESEIAQRRMDTDYELSRLANVEVRASTLGVKVSDLGGKVSSLLGDLESRLHLIDQDVDMAERTVNLTSGASFAWKDDESPILSVNAKDLNNDTDGILTLTNQRFIFESVKEIVLKKRLFIATQKKKVRETALDRPVGAVETITKGRVGFFAGQGLYITFKPQTGTAEMKLDTKGNDADLVIRFHKFIATGEAEQELSASEGAGAEKAEKKATPLICPRCGAPYSEEVYRGQTSVQCKYCNTVMPVS